jgi:hypothetical protein
MTGTDILRMQLRGSCDLIAETARASSDVWLSRAFATASLPGFTLWHCARIIDWGVQTVVRDVAEVGAAPEWRERIRYDLGHGAGLTREQADDAARTATPAAVAAYAESLRDAIDGWLDSVSDADLDRAVDVRAANRRHPLYASPEAWAEIQHLDGAPAWQVLARPCISHIRLHAGEVEALSAVLREPPAR